MTYKYRRALPSLSLSLALAACAAPSPDLARDAGLSDDASTRPDSHGSTADASVDATPPSCPLDLASLISTDEVELVEGPLPCPGTEPGIACGLWKARLRSPPASAGPVDDPSLDDALGTHPIVLAVRAPSAATPCSARWIVLDAGGEGRGYARTFGGVRPGEYVSGGGTGDDLIRRYNDAGYLTVDVGYLCDNCNSTAVAGWSPRHPGGNGWAHDTGGTGYIGAASRARAIYDWAWTNSGGARLCAHGHSSGSGRLIATLTRFGRDARFDTVVLDGGPVWAYTPWYCGSALGPLGPIPDEYDLSSAPYFRAFYDCARTPGSNQDACTYTTCTTGGYDDASYLADANFLRASDRDLDLDLHVVLGGADLSPAPTHARLWLAGYQTIPGLRARSIALRQGYCATSSGSYGGGDTRACTDWEAARYPGLAPGPTYDARLVGVPHDTASRASAIDVLFERMTATCEPR